MTGERVIAVARADELEPGELRAVEADGEQIALARVGDEFYAVQGACLHLQGPLGEGHLEDGFVTCPWHGWRYDVRTGVNDFDGAIRLRTYEVRVDDGEVRVVLGE